jgi:dihydrodipicolinate synthase/N-acetylneuraminate lyase
MRTLNSSTLQGLWAPVPTTWDASGKLDERAFRANCEKLATAGVDGLYTTDSDGEFYAIEYDEFRRLAEVFGKVVSELGVDAAMGATWCNTAGVIERLKAACDNGIPNAHIGFPFFMPLTANDAEHFYEDLAQAVPQSRWIHYAHPSLQPVLTGRDYAKLQQCFLEQLIGTKLAPAGIRELTEILVNAPDLAHFVVDPNLMTGFLLGARGCYSFFVTVLPRWQRAWVDVCKEGRWEEAAARHKKLMAWEVNHTQKLSSQGYRHGIIGKARASLSGVLQDSRNSRAPYYPVPAQQLQELQTAFDEYWSSEIAEEKEFWAQA